MSEHKIVPIEPTKEIPREKKKYSCTACGRRNIKWSEMLSYRGVRDCCPNCSHKGVMHTMKESAIISRQKESV